MRVLVRACPGREAGDPTLPEGALLGSPGRGRGGRQLAAVRAQLAGRKGAQRAQLHQRQVRGHQRAARVARAAQRRQVQRACTFYIVFRKLTASLRSYTQSIGPEALGRVVQQARGCAEVWQQGGRALLESGAAGSSAARSAGSCPAGQASSGSSGSGSGLRSARPRACASRAASWTPAGGSATYIAPLASVNSYTCAQDPCHEAATIDFALMA